ncbi:MAG TPA: sugar ABC transporter permease, partial [Clostridiales bacterium]|nr:sugar ABC transporter permease [Clostridiales bacterium]
MIFSKHNSAPKDSLKKKRRWKFAEVEVILMSMLSVIFLAVFAYAPMFGVVLAFKDGNMKLNIMDAIIKSDWVGFDNFKMFLLDPNFRDVIFNTLGLNVLMLFINFPAPIIFALFINEVWHTKYKKTLQAITNFPHFISWVVFGGICIALTDMSTGIFNPILEKIGLSTKDNPVNLQSADFFWATIIITSLIKGTGWGSIIYLAALSGVDPNLYEAAEIDGANRFHKAIYISLPMMASTITIFLLLSISNLLGNSFEHFYIFQNVLNISRSEVLTTYIYKRGLLQNMYSLSSAIGLF